ncbi:MAG: hypothetical protein J6T10_22040 [Methanobrevibacter sp.]|nr:hypothetical protein [Methanobrevibacter sp.]
MANYKIIGISTMEGDYQGTHFHNLNLQVTYENDNPKKDCYGVQTDTIKLKFSVINDVLEMGLPSQAQVESLKAKDFAHLIGETVKVYYNRFGGVEGVQILGTSDKKS